MSQIRTLSNGLKEILLIALADATIQAELVETLEEALLLNSLEDVDAASPSDGQVLKFNGTSEQWEASPGGAGGDLWSDVVDSNIIPDGNNTRDLGSSANNFKDVNAKIESM